MAMPSLTRLAGILLIVIGVAGYVWTSAASLTALIPAMMGAVLLICALVARSPDARKHAMHAALVVALVGLVAALQRSIPAVRAGEVARPAVVAQLAMAGVLLVYILLGVKSFVDARKARGK
jgi:hypothetical protein